VKVLSEMTVASVDREQPKSRRLMIVKATINFVRVVGECKGMEDVNQAGGCREAVPHQMNK
jgi:hypothetical protein